MATIVQSPSQHNHQQVVPQDQPQSSKVPEGKRKPTFEYALRKERIPMATLFKSYAPVLDAVTRLLGVTPRCDQYLEIWPPGFQTYNVLVPNFFNIPFCDAGLGIPHDLRSITAYVASRTYGCGYCSAHTSVMGTIFKGPQGTLDKNSKAIMADVKDKKECGLFSDTEFAAIGVATAVGKVPAQVTTHVRTQLATYFSEKDEEDVVFCTVIMGFLNRFMDACGMTLELEAIQVSEQKLAQTGWKAGIAYDPELDQELMDEDKREKIEREARKKGFLPLVKTLKGCKDYDANALEPIPKKEKLIYAKFQCEMGFVPYYIKRIQRMNAKRAMAYAVLLRHNTKGDEIPVELKHAMCYVMATNAQNHILKAHYAYLAEKNGFSIEKLKATANIDKVGDLFSTKERVALTLANACTPTPSTITQQLIDDCLANFKSSSVIELLIVTSCFMSLQRYTAVYVPTAYEPEIKDFVTTKGSELELPEKPCTDEQATWDDEAAAIRKQKKGKKLASSSGQ